MDTTDSTPISITLHVALCEGHATSEIRLKAAEMKALTKTVINFILSCMSCTCGVEYGEKLKVFLVKILDLSRSGTLVTPVSAHELLQTLTHIYS